MRSIFFIHSILILAFCIYTAECGELAITVLDLPHEETVYAELYKNKGKGGAVYTGSAQSKSTGSLIKVSDVKPGIYDIRLFSDSDGNGTFSENDRYIDWNTENTLMSIDTSVSRKYYISFSKGVLKTGTFRFRITDIQEPEGYIRIGLFRITNGGPGAEPFRTASFRVKEKILECECAGIPYGEYAVSIMHDINENNKADKGEPRLPQVEGEEIFRTLFPEAGIKYRGTVFYLDKETYTPKASLKHGFIRTGKLTVRIKGLTNTKGQVLVNLFNKKKGFPTDQKKAYSYKITALEAKEIVIEFTDIPFGIYGAGAVHDANSNLKMDTNFFGVPREGYGASNDAKGRFGPPSFKDASFSIDRDKVSITINMVY
jgi:uncharacterized protein (DUF2141 family)